MVSISSTWQEKKQLDKMIQITERHENDTDALRDLFYRMRLATFSWADTSQFNLSDFEKETENEHILVAYLDEVLIGFVSVWVADNFIHHLYIDEPFQNQRVGSQLIDGVVKQFGYPLRLKCEEKNIKALSFYRKKGFIEKERGQSEIGTYILFELNKG